MNWKPPGGMETHLVVEKLKDSPIFVYKTELMGDTKFVAFNAFDILYIEQCFGHRDTSMDSVERIEGCCVILKGAGPAGHLHIDVKFHEVMLRWTAFLESHNG
jgi:hypothetical protein